MTDTNLTLLLTIKKEGKTKKTTARHISLSICHELWERLFFSLTQKLYDNYLVCSLIGSDIHYVTSESKVRHFTHKVVCQKNVSSRQISVYVLKKVNKKTIIIKYSYWLYFTISPGNTAFMYLKPAFAYSHLTLQIFTKLKENLIDPCFTSTASLTSQLLMDKKVKYQWMALVHLRDGGHLDSTFWFSRLLLKHVNIFRPLSL